MYYTHVNIHIHTHTGISICVYILYIYAYIYTNINMCIYIIYIYIYIHVSTSTCKYIHVYIYVYIYMNVYMYICVHICIYIYIYMCVQARDMFASQHTLQHQQRQLLLQKQQHQQEQQQQQEQRKSLEKTSGISFFGLKVSGFRETGHMSSIKRRETALVAAIAVAREAVSTNSGSLIELTDAEGRLAYSLKESRDAKVGWQGLGLKVSTEAPYTIEKHSVLANSLCMNGDMVLAVDGVSLHTLKLPEVRVLLCGPPDSEVIHIPTCTPSRMHNTHIHTHIHKTHTNTHTHTHTHTRTRTHTHTHTFIRILVYVDSE